MKTGAGECLKVCEGFLRLVLHVMFPVPLVMYITAVIVKIYVPDIFSLT